MKIDRLVSIIMILLDRKKVSAQELAEKYEVSIRKIYRDIDSINMAGIPVWSTSGVGGGFQIMEDYKVDKMSFSEKDISTILLGLTNLSNMVRGDELISAITKIRNFIPPEKAKEVEIKANQILIDLTPWMGNKQIQVNIESVSKAIDSHHYLSFEYIERTGDKITRTVEPYQLVLKNNHWYFYGYCLLRNDFRLFKLTRMNMLKINNNTFQPRDFKKPDLSFEHSESLEKRIKLRIDKSILERILDICSYEDITFEDESHYSVYLPFYENDYYYDFILGFGDKCELLEPADIRQKLKNKINQLSLLYV